MTETSVVPSIAWENSVWFADVDDTLIDTSTVSAASSEGLRAVFEAHCGADTAVKVQDAFNALYELMVRGYRVHDEAGWAMVAGGKPAFDKLMQDVTSAQTQVQADYGFIKRWSREIFVKLAADQIGVDVSPELVQEAADGYWTTLADKASVYADALRLSDAIHAHNRPFYLLTSSDGHLTMHPDGQFTYDPVHSEAIKRQRIEGLRNKGLHFNLISIGDPEDKPHLDFFAKGLRIAEADLGHKIDTSQALMLGDSFGGDLQTPKEQQGFGLVVLRDEQQAGPTVVDSHQLTTNNLQDVLTYLT